MKQKAYKVLSIMALFIGFLGFSPLAHAGTLFPTSYSGVSGAYTATGAIIIYPPCTMGSGSYFNFSVGTSGEGSTEIVNHAGSQPCGATNPNNIILLGNDGHGNGLNITTDGTYYLTIYENGGFTEIGYYVFIISGGSFVGDGVTLTSIISVSPVDGSSVATTTLTGGATTTAVVGYVDSSDLSSTTQVTVNYSNQTCSSISVDAINAVNGTCNFSLTYPITTVGSFSFSTSTLFNYIGKWQYVASIQDTNNSLCIFGYCLINNSTELAQVTGSFVVSTSSGIDNLVSEIASTSAGIGNLDLSACKININPFASSTFDILGCVEVLFVPNASATQAFMTSYAGQFLNYFPLGYATRLVQIMSSGATTTLPAISYTFSSSSALSAVGTVSFDPFGALAGSSSISQATSDVTGAPETVWQIMNPVITDIVYLLLLFMIIHDITGISKHKK